MRHLVKREFQEVSWGGRKPLENVFDKVVCQCPIDPVIIDQAAAAPSPRGLHPPRRTPRSAHDIDVGADNKRLMKHRDDVCGIIID